MVARANAEWTAWHTATGAPRNEGQVDAVRTAGRLLLAAAGSILPDTLTAMQAAAHGTDQLRAFLAPSADATTIAAEATRIRGSCWPARLEPRVWD